MALATAPDNLFMVPIWGVALAPAATWNCTQYNESTLPQLAVRLSISLVCCKQRNERIKWKAIVVCEKVNSASKVNR